MDSMKNLTPEQQQLVKEIMWKESRQRKVDKIVLTTKLKMIIDALQPMGTMQEQITKLQTNLEAIQEMAAW